MARVKIRRVEKTQLIENCPWRQIIIKLQDVEIANDEKSLFRWKKMKTGKMEKMKTDLIENCHCCGKNYRITRCLKNTK